MDLIILLKQSLLYYKENVWIIPLSYSSPIQRLVLVVENVKTQ